MGGRSKLDPRYGKGEHTIEFDDECLIDEEALAARILETFNTADYRPPTLPAVALELVELAQKPEVSFEEIVALLEQDSLLAGRVLRLAQSPVYAGSGAVTSLHQALVRMGLRSLRDLVLEAAMNNRVFRAPGYTESMERLSRHSTATAHLCRIISKYTPIEGEYAFMCGLLHDVGMAGVMIALGDVSKRKKAPDLSVLWPAIDRSHEEVSVLMTKLWKLPPEIPMALGAHHQVHIDGFPHPLSATVCLADQLSQELGFGLVPPESEDAEGDGLATHANTDQSSEVPLKRAREALNVDERTIELVRSDAQALFEKGF